MKIVFGWELPDGRPRLRNPSRFIVVIWRVFLCINVGANWQRAVILRSPGQFEFFLKKLNQPVQEWSRRRVWYWSPIELTRPKPKDMKKPRITVSCLGPVESSPTKYGSYLCPGSSKLSLDWSFFDSTSTGLIFWSGSPISACFDHDRRWLRQFEYRIVRFECIFIHYLNTFKSTCNSLFIQKRPADLYSCHRWIGGTCLAFFSI